MVGSEIIDRIGIQKATQSAVANVLRKFKKKPDLVLLDGSLFAPEHYNQKTIIKGDEKIPLIAAASIIAKTTRDAKMLRFHKKFPRYCFDAHKGYGTKLHYKMIRRHGLSLIHRRSFCKNCKN
jgi:ribonuclease HII